MRIGEAVSTLRVLIKEVSDDSNYTDSFLWSMIATCKNPEKLDVPHNRSMFCIELIPAKAHNCACVSDTGCNILVSKYTIPKVVNNGYKDLMTVSDLGGNTFGYSTETELLYSKFDPIKSKATRWNLINDRLQIYNNLTLPIVRLNGLWENIIEWADIQYCGSNPCLDVYDMDAGFGQMDADEIYFKVLNLLRFSFSRKEDTTSDKNPEIR